MKYLIAVTAFAVCAVLALSAQADIVIRGPKQDPDKPWRVWATIGADDTIYFLRSHKTEGACRDHARQILWSSGGVFPDPSTGTKLPIRRLWCKPDGFHT